MSINLLTDLWSDNSLSYYIALACSCVNINFKIELYVLGILPMYLPHNAENIKKKIVEIVNSYDFDKSLIHGKNLRT